jgi:DNA-directed RNA polymerase subunit beta
MDQTNPLAEITHKRRLSALGPGGLSRERAGFEVRDVHYTHYGRLCPIETPEGPNIGLISSLCIYAKINNLGFIETPYRKAENGVVDLDNDHIVYMTAEDEENATVAQGNAPLDENGAFIRTKVKSRYEADFPVVAPSEVDLMDVSPSQIASIAAALIPFLEHDDANRALMGSNMMRQAVPLVRSEAPIVGTGIEGQLIQDSRTQIVAEGSGEVTYVDADYIRVKYDRTEEEEFISFESSEKEYRLPKFQKTNQNTTIDLRPIVRKGDRVEQGQILTEGYATENGELALGKNLKVAYIPWKGYNYEDAIVLSERIVREDMFTSVHVVEQLLEVRETKRGMEEFTADIPNVSEEATKDLDENGIIRIGAHINPGDIIIGKITPKGESDPSPEEKLLKAIFGDMAGDVKDASLKASPSLSGVVIDKKLYARAQKERKQKLEDKEKIARLDAEFKQKAEDLRHLLIDKLATLLKNRQSQGVFDLVGTEFIPKGVVFTKERLNQIDFQTVMLKDWTIDAHRNEMVQQCIMKYMELYKELDAKLKREKFNMTIGDELPNGIIKVAKVYVAKSRKIRVGDKMAGRHGNKGIVSKIVRVEDMPFLADGTPVDIVLNPLGVPSRMNIGQIFEAVLGWAGKEMGVKFATPIFDGCTLDSLNEWTDKAGLPRAGKTQLYDGGTGEAFDQMATVGVTYFMKLGHMVDDKMHARSIGPYSLITQQPLGGKAQFGGQRFGEMEVWALEAHGAAHILQEILTVKSDDVTGRARTYEAIVKGEPMPTPGLPESLNVLIHELQGLALSITME